jgi:ribosome-associated protein
MEFTAEQIKEKILILINEKQGKDASCLDLKELAGYTDYFIICHTDIEKQAQAVAHHIENGIRESFGIKPYSMEGFSNGKWILIDYIDVICHIFIKESRDYYNLEKLWAGAFFLPGE